MSKEKPIKKGYRVDLTRIEEGFLYCEMSCVADTRNQARSLLLKQIEEASLSYSDDPIEYKNIPVVRYDKEDVFLIDSIEVTREQLEKNKKQKKFIAALTALEQDSSVIYCYIRKGGYLYKPNYVGYTEKYPDAGVYTKKDAISAAKGCSELILEPIDADKHNAMLNQAIEELKSKTLILKEKKI